jgi:hypothetical protein
MNEPENLDDLVEKILPLAQEINRLHQIKLQLTQEEVAHILREQSTDTNRIAHCLDSFLDLTMFGVGEQEFLDFLQYVFQVDEDLALDYYQFYKEDKEADENFDLS